MQKRQLTIKEEVKKNSGYFVGILIAIPPILATVNDPLKLFCFFLIFHPIVLILLILLRRKVDPSYYE